jgi:PKHD-type hydroxylase
MRLTNYIYIENFLSEEECKRVIQEGQNKRDPSVKNTITGFIEYGSPVQDLMQKTINAMVESATKYYGCHLTDFEPMRYWEYVKGMKSDWHSDSNLSIDQTNRTRDVSASLILSKNTDYTGGSLQFILPEYISSNNTFVPKDADCQNQGTLIMFPSSLIHGVSKITSGIRKSLIFWSVSNI